MTKDYYEVLGVDRSATRAEVKKAFRRLAKQLHPDINDADDAEDRFKELSEAYEVLADDVKRAEYDASGGSKVMFEKGFDWNDFTKYDDIRDIFGGHASPWEVYQGRRGYRAPQMGRDKVQEVVISLDEAFSGTTRGVDVPTVAECRTCHGSGAFPGTKVEVCPVCRGLGQIKEVTTRGYNRYVSIQSCMRCFGKGKISGSACEVCGGKGTTSSERRIEVRVPPGVGDGTSLRIPGEGEEGILGGRRGDLYVRVRVAPDDRFERDGDDLVTEAGMSFSHAALGGTLEVATLDGTAKVTVPPGTQTHTLLRLKGRGMPRLEGAGRGDLLVRVVVVTPDRLTKRERELLEEMAMGGGGTAAAPGNTGRSSKGGIFKRFKSRKRD